MGPAMNRSGELLIKVGIVVLACHLVVWLQYIDGADRSPSAVPSEVLETVSALNEHGDYSEGPSVESFAANAELRVR